LKKYIDALMNGTFIAMISITVVALAMTAYNGFANKTIKPSTTSEYSATSVLITGYDGKSGGTGVILSSKKGESKILTNAHVCGILNGGGLVSSDKTKAIVEYFQISRIHDLCLITTRTNFRTNTVVSENEPEVYDEAIVSGHPHLLPNIITRGHFSQKEIINVLVGIKPCTIEDLTNDEVLDYCNQLGIIPILKTFEAQVVSATIMPGSSGSAVFNSRGEIAGLVFAGSGDFGYGFVVPHEYIFNFINLEVISIRPMYPKKYIPVSKNGDIHEIKKSCASATSKKVLEFCELLLKKSLLIN